MSLETETPDTRADGLQKTSTMDERGGAAVRDAATDDEYRLISVDAVRAPEGCTGGDWYSYRIARGESRITGYRRGDIARVRTDVETIVIGLNGRRQWTNGKAPSRTQRRAAAAVRRATAK